MKQKLFGFLRPDRRGLALISVLGVVTLAMILILALFSVSDSEYKASRVYSEGATAHHLADNAINIVMGQIQAAATGSGTTIAPTGSAPLGSTIWASQPGAVRVYDSGGHFILGRTLYSSSHMVYQPAGGLAGEKAMADYAPDGNWANALDQWVDLNKPVTRSKLGLTQQVYFPIFDPRATIVGGILSNGQKYTPPEGFSILLNSTGTGSHTVSSAALGVITNTIGGGTAPAQYRLPMPVEWLYVLKDGSVGTVQAAGGGGPAQWVATGGKSGPTEENPIIGRVGFWTDDECCKIDINTAGEPGYWSTPVVLHDRERKWADSPPAVFEYQRYPGHPATVALSSVFSPGFNDDNYYSPGGNAVNQSGNLTFKNSIYTFVPRLAPGGTNDGQIPFAADAFNTSQVADLGTLELAIMKAKTEPFYASVDESLFNTTMGPLGRGLNLLSDASGAPVINPEMLERSRAFLTAHSRAPETNMFGLPRVAIWPVPDTSPPPGGVDWHAYRTGYDSAVATCAKLGTVSTAPEGALTEVANSYYFRRLDPSNELTDMGRNGGSVGMVRNGALMNYLDNLIRMTMPGGQSFFTKYTGSGGNDAEQVLVEIFDYIRCTNLYDGFLADGDGTPLHQGYQEVAPRDDTLPSKLSVPISVLWDTAPKRNAYYTYTPPRFNVLRKVNDEGLTGLPTQAVNQYNSTVWPPVKTGAYPGHGQVKPIEWVPPGSSTILKGFGRFPTISEVALQFICTADGLPDAGSYQIIKAGKPILSGGKTAERINTKNYQQRQAFTHKNNYGVLDNEFYYSNIPPKPSASLFTSWGCSMANVGKGTPDDPTKHPGWDPTQWNCTLDYNPSTRSGVPLNVDEKRIQICLLIETFVPSVGYTKYVPDYTMVLNGSQVSGIKVMDGSGVWRSVFSTTGPQVVQSTYTFVGGDARGQIASHNVSPLGGSFSPAAITSGRQVIAIGQMPADPSYQTAQTGSISSQMLNFPLVSNFLTVKRTDPSGRPANVQFKVEQPLEIDIYASHDWQGTQDPGHAVPSQRVNVKFPTGQQTTPVPHLVVYSSEPREYTDSSGYHKWDAIPCVRWWAFNYAGAIARYTGQATVNGNEISWNVKSLPPTEYTYGRFHSTGYGTIYSKDTYNPAMTAASNGISTPSDGLVYGYSTVTGFNGVLGDPTKADFYKNIAPANMGEYAFYGTDSIRSLIPRHGDYRILAARKVVNQDVWDRHPVWKAQPNALFAHSLSGAYSDAVVGFDLGGGTATGTTTSASGVNPQYALVPGAWYEFNTATQNNRIGALAVWPDTPLSPGAAAASSRFRDFDNGPGNLRDGSYINKADDGTAGVMEFYHPLNTYDPSHTAPGFYLLRNTYFTSSFLQLPSKNAFFTPNRMISSPGMFGSLSTGVWGSISGGGHTDPVTAANAATDGVPWRTLLFRADVDGHVGAPSWSSTGTAGGGVDPADHYFMDLFFMPVIEPYAITDSYSTAGKINLNYQIVPFTYIRRTTALNAAMKGEIITAFSSQDTNPLNAGGLKPSATNTAIYKKIKDNTAIPPLLYDEATDHVYWHRQINVDETLKQLDERFSFNPSSYSTARGAVGLMLSPSQICEVHLIPNVPTGTARPGEPVMTGLNGATRRTAMVAYWLRNDLTGDNTRERPYANLYQKFTTRSNTFRVFFTAQTLKKARSLPPNQVDTRKDTVTAEYRGSALFERYLDFSAAGAAKLAKYDYGAGAPMTGMPTLEDSYHYRIIEMKQFSP